jgi:hypothetical protein
MNPLLNFTAWAFYRHHNVTLVGHYYDSAADSTTNGTARGHKGVLPGSLVESCGGPLVTLF